MSIHTLDRANLINELQCGQSVGRAVHDNRRADFALLLAMLSQDVRDHTAVDQVEEAVPSDLREQFLLPQEQQLQSNQESYLRGIEIAAQFNNGGMVAAKLQSCLAPDALTYLPEQTHNLPEEVYHNLSGHQRRELDENNSNRRNFDYQLYHSLVVNQRQSQIQTQLYI